MTDPSVFWHFPFLRDGRAVWHFPFRDASGKKKWKFPYRPPTEGSDGVYQGPLDIVPGAVFAYGQRALSLDMLGQPLYTIREGATSTIQSFDSDAATGAAPVTAITSFLNGASGFVTNWRDQSGGAHDMVQATTNQQPEWLVAQAGTVPGFRGLGTLESTAGIVWAADSPCTLFLVSGMGDGGTNVDVHDHGGKDIALVLSDGFNEFTSTPPYADWSYEDTTLAVVLYELTVTASGEVVIYENGVAKSVTADPGPFALPAGTYGTLITIGASDMPTFELMGWAALLSAGDRLAIRQNIMTYYGI